MEIIILPAVPASNDNAELVACQGCAVRPAAAHGLCADCDAEMAAHYDDRRGGDEWLTDE